MSYSNLKDGRDLLQRQSTRLRSQIALHRPDQSAGVSRPGCARHLDPATTATGQPVEGGLALAARTVLEVPDLPIEITEPFLLGNIILNVTV
jgi:hypothetical protein